ncbi:multifunctional CCA tRNA nucleotidyl transferase/2'3'-cyclic phosphodiesterase/2'nucleotidase/phosphatase [Alkalilimnicola ehrlichii]|uniref:Multifunctional CCA protein n=1 Tax=Alkalilimnicola ehrlichii TaxID=351052 RepID=A0A3E0WZU7_9GAMM|nr:multifunctional CCA addition/repair protein [Alkalilimnicola ehrlichii]RFA30177.1 multifunctional CCA tRNA nucleotidyl transferase/2'3'-cyclic phosphodiesterase/2'nucleotidase/phosphatase [Alkalilimnicola ehrlichii]RFA37525.1 multifunctional CCA tRNA nucleotidyl transferase/2'3'-cyclic phosphodiesterase/2'nucleotidase/phosphatase [Alkalilimnicola ehrlichii]
MNVYLVGGAVRDRLLGLPARERDWVVVGATPQTLEAQGFQPVGKDFPVFLHPETKEEYALARTERKTAPGYQGFQFHASPEVTLDEDLRRRDLTINAIARKPDGSLIDPFNGVADLHARILRHVSPAFAEDPVRILRLARFAARFSPLGFQVAEETLALARQMVAAGEVDALVPERVWQELSRALMEPRPSAFIRTLRDCGALARLLPEIDCLFGVPQPEAHHPEIDTGLHTLLALDMSAHLRAELSVRFAVLVHDLGKGVTPTAELPSHRGHEGRGVPLVDAVCERLRVPRAPSDLGRLVAKFHLHCHRAFELKPSTVLKVLEGLDAFRRPERVAQFTLACECDARGRTGLESQPYPQRAFFEAAYAAAATVDARRFVEQGLRGAQIGEAVRQARVKEIATIKETRTTSAIN